MKASVWHRSRCRVLLSVFTSSDTATSVYFTRFHTASSEALALLNVAISASGRSLDTASIGVSPYWSLALSDSG